MAVSYTKHPCWSLLLILSIAKFFRALILKNIYKRMLLKMCLIKLFIKRINFTLKNLDFFNINMRNKWKYLLLFHDWFPMKLVFIDIQYFFGMVRNRSSHRRCSVGQSVLRNFSKFTGKHLRQGLVFNFINRVTLLKKRLWDRCFPVNFATFSRTPFWQNTSGQLLLEK